MPETSPAQMHIFASGISRSFPHEFKILDVHVADNPGLHGFALM